MTTLSRRDFLKLGGLSFWGLAARPLRILPPASHGSFPLAIGRVTVDTINIYEEPSFQSRRIGRKARDQLVSLLEEVVSPDGPAHNPVWYRLVDGYAHRGRIQRIDLQAPNRALDPVPENGTLAEVTAPYTRAYRYLRGGAWQRLYRLYYRSVHWVVDLDEGPDGKPWYRLEDHLIHVEYHVPAADLRQIPPETYSPLSPEVPPDEKRIEISIAGQDLRAYEGEKMVFQASIASGLPSPKNLPPDEIPSDTPLGSFWIQTKIPSRHMGDGRLTDDIYDYELPGVPWTMLFHEHGVALHGTYWHDNFGVRMSHGCVNMRNSDALWLFRWTNPVYDPASWFKREAGTLIKIS